MTRFDRADPVADRAARDSLRQQIAFLGMGMGVRGSKRVHLGIRDRLDSIADLDRETERR